MMSKDFDIRASLVRQLLADGFSRHDIRHEITLDTSSSGGRADVVILRDDAIHGVELKSASDTLTRLSEQKKAYKRAFDFVHVILDQKHAKKYEEMYMNAYAYSQEDGIFCWYSKRPGKIPFGSRTLHRSSETSPKSMVRLLWQQETEEVTTVLGTSRRTRHSAIEWLAENASLKQIRPLVIKALRKRQLSAWENSFWGKYDEQQSTLNPLTVNEPKER